MKIQISKPLLKSALDKCNPILHPKPPMPVMSCALLEASGSMLAITLTNMEQRIVAKAECEVIKEGSTCISFKRLLDLTDKMSGDITISVNDQNVALVSCGNANAKIAGLPASEYVAKANSGDPVSSFRDKDGILASCLRKVKNSASHEQPRPVLNGVHFTEKDGALYLEASDGRRGHAISTCIKANPNIIVPNDAVDAIANLFDECDCEFRVFENRLEVISETTELETKLIEGAFPNFKALVPERQKNSIIFQREELTGAMKIVSTMLDDAGRLTIDSKKSGITISSKPEFGSDNEGVEVKLEGKQKVELKFIINAAFLKDVISSTDAPEICIEAKDSNNPILICDDQFLAVIMPIRMPA